MDLLFNVVYSDIYGLILHKEDIMFDQWGDRTTLRSTDAIVWDKKSQSIMFTRWNGGNNIYLQTLRPSPANDRHLLMCIKNEEDFFAIASLIASCHNMSLSAAYTIGEYPAYRFIADAIS